jgi:hypothetical protein
LAAHRIGADEQPPIYQPECIEPLLSLIPPLVADPSEPVHQHLGAKGERDTMLKPIDLVLFAIKLEIHTRLYGLAV